ncbi:MAG: hypothetical protein O2992_04850 [Gemmatimonadetes bacterium]|nr:hypothetical protein [Gemmatimonadota bacterium]
MTVPSKIAPSESVTSAPWYPIARELSDGLLACSGDSVRVVLLYGSHLLAVNRDRHSAFDFVVIVDDYTRFYRALRQSGELDRWVWIMAGLSRVLPPNVIAFAPSDGVNGIAKCLIVSRSDFERALGSRPKDHFLLGRLVQKVGLVCTRSAEDGAWVERVLARARSRVLDWMAPYLREPIDGAALGRRLLEVCYQGEFRPEAVNRAESIFRAQEDHFQAAFDGVLARAASEGTMIEDGGAYRLAHPAPESVARRWRWHFRRSKVRATARWLKHIVTFDKWLPYVVRKAERHSGTKIELTPLERRWPLLFLWPRVIRYLRNRPPKEISR